MNDNKTQIICKHPDELFQVARELLSKFPENRLFAFYGEMGAGKTTFIKSICKQLNVIDNIASPTFSIVNVYQTQTSDEVYHFDFYRIKELEEVYDIGYEDYFFSGNYCLMEWPEKVESLLPEDTIIVKIQINPADEARIFTF